MLNFKPDHDLVPSSGDLVSRSSSGDVEPVQSENVTHDNPVCENGLQNKPVVSAPESEPIVVRRGGGSVRVWKCGNILEDDVS